MDYNNFSEETKKFINKAMDIYFTIKEKNIQKINPKAYNDKYQFTKFDKKVLALFIAGFMVDGQLKNILEDYEDIRLSDLLSFINISENQIRKLDDENYSTFYSENFAKDFENIFKVVDGRRQINYITPKLIVSCLRFVNVNGSYILDLYASHYHINSTPFSEHPIFKTLELSVLKDGSVSKPAISSKDAFDQIYSPSNIEPLIDDLLKKMNVDKNLLLVNKYVSEDMNHNKINKKSLITSDIIDPKVWQFLDEIQKMFVGQEVAVENLFNNIVNNLQMVQNKNLKVRSRSLIFLDGPSGTGKTAITSEIAEKLGVPFVATSISNNYSAIGYSGGDITDILRNLYYKANGDIELAQQGIVILDEFEKLAYSSQENDLIMKEAIQEQLLDFLGGGKYTIRVGKSMLDKNEIEFDTSRLTFVCLGALTDLHTSKITKKRSIGFGQSSGQNEQQDYTITPQDLVGLGLKKELVGRFNTYLHTNDYSREDYIKQLKESTISPLIGFREWIEIRGKKLEIDEDVYYIIADQAYELNMGARGLQTIINNIRSHFLRIVLRENDPIIHLDAETVLEIGRQTTSRKGRA